MYTKAMACLSISTLGSELGRATPLSIPVLWISITLMRIRLRIRIRLITLMRIRILIFIWCGSGSDFSFQIKAQTLEKVLKKAHIPYILACHLPIGVDPVPDPAYHFDADPDADPDPDFYLMRTRIRCGSGSTKLLNTTDLTFFFFRLECRPPVTCRPPPLSVEGSELGQHSR